MGVMSEGFIKKYGLPTALAAMLGALVYFMVRQQTEMLSDQIEFTNRLVDAFCTPQKADPAKSGKEK